MVGASPACQRPQVNPDAAPNPMTAAAGPGPAREPMFTMGLSNLRRYEYARFDDRSLRDARRRSGGAR
eukprot:COSAG05_NODE_2111_length_3547_cov_3.036833_2_plen_68_part_00